MMPRPIPDLSPAFLERFWSHADYDPESGCLLWTGAHSARGYGRITISGVAYRTHRVAWKATTGEDPLSLHVLHWCDNPPCLLHLFLGTQATNMADMKAKGRADRLLKRRGEHHYNARLTPTAVRLARERHATGESAASIARSLGVHSMTILDIIHNRTWRHIA